MSEEINGMVEVVLPSGAKYPVYEQEVAYVDDRRSRYLKQNSVSNISDFQDMDRVLMGELFCYRWSVWLSRGLDYWGSEVDTNDLQKSLNDQGRELRLLKKQLGIDKATREKSKSESVAEYIADVLSRGKEFGVHRENQGALSIELFQRLGSLITLHNNLDEEERVEMHMTRDDLFEIIETELIPEFERLDAYFRENQQRFWIQDI